MRMSLLWSEDMRLLCLILLGAFVSLVLWF